VGGRSRCGFKPDVLAVDCDDPSGAPRLWEIAGQLKGMDYPPVVVESGQAGHLHLIARVPDPDQLGRLKAIARDYGLDVRAVIRPPLSPHRLGLPVRIVRPGDDTEALERLTRPVTRDISTRIQGLLEHGAVTGPGARFPSRSEVFQAIALGFVLAGRTEGDLLAAALDQRNHGAVKVREQADPADYVHRSSVKAQSLRDANPMVGHPERARDYAHRVWEAMLSVPWPGRSGGTDFFVLAAAVHTADIAWKVDGFGLDRLRWQRLADVSDKTLTASRKRLIESGWLCGHGQPARWQTALWSVHGPEGVWLFPYYVHTPLRVLIGELSEYGDLWVKRGLGKTAARIWLIMGDTPVTVKQVSDTTGIPSGTVYDRLAAMGKVGMVRRGPKATWVAQMTLTWRTRFVIWAPPTRPPPARPPTSKGAIG